MSIGAKRNPGRTFDIFCLFRTAQVQQKNSDLAIVWVGSVGIGLLKATVIVLAAKK